MCTRRFLTLGPHHRFWLYARLAAFATTSLLIACGPTPGPDSAADKVSAPSSASAAVVPAPDGQSASDDQPVAAALELGVGIVAELPAELGGGAFHLRSGDALPSGASLSIALEVTQPAHLYVFQIAPGGKTAPLFPSAAMGTHNPVDKAVAIPGGGHAFKLDDKDLGATKLVMVAASEPIAELDAAMANPESADLAAWAGRAEGKIVGAGSADGSPKAGSIWVKAANGSERLVAVVEYDHVKAAGYRKPTGRKDPRGIVAED